MAEPRKPHRVHEEAILDLRLGARFYEKRRSGLGQEFVLAVDKAIATIVEAPQRWPRFFGAQRYLLDRFPYSIIYSIGASADDAVAQMHATPKDEGPAARRTCGRLRPG